MSENLRAAEWGPRVNLAGLQEHFKGTKVTPRTVTPGGIDNLALHSTDVFTIPGKGEFEVDFRGYFRVARSQPTSKDWTTFDITVNITDLRMFAEHKQLGNVSVSLNPALLSSGQIFHATTQQGNAKCRIATGVTFDMPQLGVRAFNKEPILLMNENVKSIPPVDDPNGHALLFMLPLFDEKNPSGNAVAYLTSLRYGADNYISEAEVKALRERKL
jgi:hypothetical protein